MRAAGASAVFTPCEVARKNAELVDWSEKRAGRAEESASGSVGALALAESGAVLFEHLELQAAELWARFERRELRSSMFSGL